MTDSSGTCTENTVEHNVSLYKTDKPSPGVSQHSLETPWCGPSGTCEQYTCRLQILQKKLKQQKKKNSYETRSLGILIFKLQAQDVNMVDGHSRTISVL